MVNVVDFVGVEFCLVFDVWSLYDGELYEFEFVEYFVCFVIIFGNGDCVVFDVFSVECLIGCVVLNV